MAGVWYDVVAGVILAPSRLVKRVCRCLIGPRPEHHLRPQYGYGRSLHQWKFLYCCEP